MASPALAHLESLLRARKLDAAVGASPPLSAERGPEPAPGGVAALDARLGGGWPRGQVSEIVGPRSAGRTWVMAQALAQATQRGELAALVDATDSFDPAAAEAALRQGAATGAIHWPYVLWVRGQALSGQPAGGAAAGRAPAPASIPAGEFTVHTRRPPRRASLHEQALDRAIKAVGLVLQAGGFGVVALDLSDVPPALVRGLPFTTWLRLARLVEGRDTACLILTPEPITRSAQGVSLRLRSGDGDAGHGRAAPSGLWHGDHPRARWLGGLRVEARVVRTRWQAADEQSFTIETAPAGASRGLAERRPPAAGPDAAWPGGTSPAAASPAAVPPPAAAASPRVVRCLPCAEGHAP
jgi:hypothetical protein